MAGLQSINVFTTNQTQTGDFTLKVTVSDLISGFTNSSQTL